MQTASRMPFVIMTTSRGWINGTLQYCLESRRVLKVTAAFARTLQKAVCRLSCFS